MFLFGEKEKICVLDSVVNIVIVNCYFVQRGLRERDSQSISEKPTPNFKGGNVSYIMF